MGKVNSIREIDKDEAMEEIVEILDEASIEFLLEVYQKVCRSDAFLNQTDTKIIVEDWD